MISNPSCTSNLLKQICQDSAKAPDAHEEISDIESQALSDGFKPDIGANHLPTTPGQEIESLQAQASGNPMQLIRLLICMLE